MRVNCGVNDQSIALESRRSSPAEIFLEQPSLSGDVVPRCDEFCEITGKCRQETHSHDIGGCI